MASRLVDRAHGVHASTDRIDRGPHVPCRHEEQLRPGTATLFGEVAQSPVKNALIREQRPGILLGGAVGEELDELVLANPWRHPFPQGDPVAGRLTVTGQFADFDARHERPPPLLEVERQRTGDHQQVSVDGAIRRDGTPGIVRLRSSGVVFGPVDRVHDACLGR